MTVEAIALRPAPPHRSRRELERIARDGHRMLQHSDPMLVLQWAVDTFGDRLAVTSSMTDSVLPHLVSRAAPGTDVLFVDTGYHFAETLGTRDAVAATLPLNIISITAGPSRAEHEARNGELWRRDPDACCALRKVDPLNRAMEGYDAWVTGLRRDESPTRRHAQIIEWDESRQKVKINPLVEWTQFDMDRYTDWYGLLVNPLVSEGYASIGCAPCTRAVAPGENPRSGRWAGSSKVECGLHR